MFVRITVRITLLPFERVSVVARGHVGSIFWLLQRTLAIDAIWLEGLKEPPTEEQLELYKLIEYCETLEEAAAVLRQIKVRAPVWLCHEPIEHRWE